ncbi:MAG TPA: hypothetical protein VEK79_13840 [Thermoanaerobaculia bacterium]|nr:hypothetical protein [Thermoanaerobaculia bacterium]
MPAKTNSLLKPTSRRPELTGLLGALWFICSLAAASACYGQNTTAAKPRAVADNVSSDAAFAQRRVPATPSPVIDIVEIQPFRLKVGYRHDWLRDRLLVKAGLLVVLRVDPKYVVPRDTFEPVLYAGDQTVQRLSQGHRSGYVIGIIPGQVDLAVAPIWFGRPQLPERVTPEIIKAERALANRAGIKAFGRDRIDRARRQAIEVDDLAALLRGAAADLVLKYSPDEKNLAEAWRLPRAGSNVPR